jgi:hypothetical protein
LQIKRNERKEKRLLPETEKEREREQVNDRKDKKNVNDIRTDIQKLNWLI